jgi:hypothetical protein
MYGGSAPSGYGPERGVLGSGSSAKRGVGAEHYKTHMDSSATGALLTWDDAPSSSRPGTAPVRDDTGARPGYGHKGRGPRYAREMLAGTGAAKGTGFYTGVASHYETSDRSEHPEPTSTAAGVHQAAHKGRGPQHAREALAGRGAAIETGFYTDVARYWGSDDSKAGSSSAAAGGASAVPSRNRKAQYASRELVGSGAARELPGPVVSARTATGAAAGGDRPAVWNRRDLSVRDAEASSMGVARSHWETESASMMGGHRAGWRDPLQGAVPVRTGRKPSAQAQHDRFKPTTLW